MSKFTDSARLSAIGYIHQILSYSLYLALRRPDNVDRTIFIERFDDIELCEGEDTIESLQIKHVSINLTNRSSDLWTTLRAWSDNYLAGLVRLPDSILTIVTTAKVPKGSIASFLQLENRDPAKACDLLIAETQKPVGSLKKQFAAFNKLLPDQQRRLVKAIYIQDEAPHIERIPQKIKNIYSPAVQPDNIDRLYDLLTGWWQRQVVTHLRNGSKSPIRVSAVLSKIADINDTLKERKISDPFFDDLPPEDYDWDDRTFVLQMKLVNLPTRTRLQAIRNQYRASKLRDWLVNEAHLTDLVEYDQQLKEEWEFIFGRVVGDSDTAFLSDEKAQKIGKEIYFDVQKFKIHIHNQLRNAYITRGSFHILADNEPNPIVGWHPNFKELLSSGKE